MSRQPGSTSHPASGTSTPSAGHALPSKPPAAQGASFAFKPRNVTAAAQKPARPTLPQPPAYPAQPTYDMNASADYPQQYTDPSQQYAAGYDYSMYQRQTPSAIQNPFPLPSEAGYAGAYSNADAEFDAQMQQWQANYGNIPADTRTGAGKPVASGNANYTPMKFNRLDGAPAASTAPLPVAIDNRKTVARTGGGQKWEDSTLLEWGNHHRIFVGNLAGEVTDDSLLKAFAKYPSVQKARVIREKHTTKSKGFGFVSFSDADEYFRAAREMNGKYIGSHPISIKRAETEIKAVTKKEEKDKNSKRNKSKGSGSAAGNKGALGPQPGQGVQKKAPKGGETKYKMLG